MTTKEINTPEQKELEAVVVSYAKSQSCLVKTKATMDEKILGIRAKYDDKLQKLQAESDMAFANVKEVADANRQSIFTKSKRINTSRGSVGYRLGKPKLVLTEGKAWSDLTEKVQALAPDYVRVKVEVAKDRLFADRDLPHVKALLDTIGATVVQDEQFYVELK